MNLDIPCFTKPKSLKTQIIELWLNGRTKAKIERITGASPNYIEGVTGNIGRINQSRRAMLKLK